jgi:hypothetical protein
MQQNPYLLIARTRETQIFRERADEPRHLGRRFLRARDEAAQAVVDPRSRSRAHFGTITERMSRVCVDFGTFQALVTVCY